MQICAGIDYGKKTGGTTAFAIGNHPELYVHTVPPGKDADAYIVEWISTFLPTHVGIDAPLSLPGVYAKLDGYKDYFYRECDRELKAMSPMFLGGLTARAIKLANQIRGFKATIYEVYPKMGAHRYDLGKFEYKRSKSGVGKCLHFLEKKFEKEIKVDVLDWHQIDAILAWDIVKRQIFGDGLHAGDPKEGLIYY